MQTYKDENTCKKFYILAFIDDYFREIWVYTLKSKDYIFKVFKQFKALIEHQIGKKLECIHTYNDGEYLRPLDTYGEE